MGRVAPLALPGTLCAEPMPSQNETITVNAPLGVEPAYPGAELVPLIDDRLERFLASRDLPENLRDAVAYSLLSGGKRLRPILSLLSAEAVGGSHAAATPAAIAVELVHAFSLVHDDLPAMDDDDLRRGRPTLHVARGEAMAILAGDLMLSLAFEALTDGIDDPALVGVLSAELAAGVRGMIAGQVYDTLGGFEPGLSERERLETIHHNKTGALIRASARMGAISAFGIPDSGSARPLSLLTTYADAVGLMFQIVDDLLDVEQSAEHLGKGAGKDLDAGKRTYPGIVGVEESRREVDRLRCVALDAAAALGPNARPLADLCGFLAVRTK